MSISLVAVIVFLAAASAISAVILGVADLRSARTVTATDGATSHRAIRLRRRTRTVESDQSSGPIGRFDRWFRQMVRETGMTLDSTTAVWLLVFCGVLAGGGLFVWNEHPFTVFFGLLLGMAVPLAYLIYRRGKRVKQLQDQLPPALDMLARGVRAGQSLDQALDLVGTHSPEPLAANFRYCAKQLEMGLSMPVVMKSLVERVRLYDVRIFTTTLSLHRQTGGNVARVLQRLANVIRDRLSYRRQLRVATGAGKLSAIVVGTAGPALFLFFICFRPEYLHAMMNTPLGQSLLVLAVALEVVGLIWIARLLKPAY